MDNTFLGERFWFCLLQICVKEVVIKTCDSIDMTQAN